MFEIRWLISATLFFKKANEALRSQYTNHLKAVNANLEHTQVTPSSNLIGA